MNKKGFTLVELLAVITILVILTFMLLPTIERMTRENKEKIYQQQLENIVLSLKSWAGDNREYLPEEEGTNLTITLGTLKSEGYIEYDVKNPLTNKCFSNEMLLIVTRIKKNFDYSIDVDTIRESNGCEIDTDSPIIILNGNAIENVEVNSIYVDKGVIAKDKDGNDITDNVITTISGSGNVVDTSTIGNQYIITYSVTAHGKTIQVSRTVKVVDTEAPELIIPSDSSIDVVVTSFDIMDGVSATDNSGEIINVTAKSNITFGIPGKYTITYTASDSSGNTTIKKRKLAVVSSDTEPPSCILKVNADNTVTFDSKAEDAVYYGISTSQTAEYNSESIIPISVGTIYGYVKDAAGNTGNCSVSIENTIKSGYCASGYYYQAPPYESCYKWRDDAVGQEGAGASCICTDPGLGQLMTHSNTSEIECKNFCADKGEDYLYTVDTYRCIGGGTWAGKDVGTGKRCYYYGDVYYNYNCSAGYTKLSNTYCYKTSQ